MSLGVEIKIPMRGSTTNNYKSVECLLYLATVNWQAAVGDPEIRVNGLYAVFPKG